MILPLSRQKSCEPFFLYVTVGKMTTFCRIKNKFFTSFEAQKNIFSRESLKMCKKLVKKTPKMAPNFKKSKVEENLDFVTGQRKCQNVPLCVSLVVSH